ncbi:polysaccharide deacetylase family protein [Algibacter sp. PT7-4]|uniref:polysaccharide deacetylase family protein n=1 Tax=Algibacter ulvanivorans TaxID=3400999 RepID=UPI003AAEF3DD
MKNVTGKFVMSLDFELLWGVLDVKNVTNYKNHILGVKKAIPELLNLFELYNVKATFAIVGFLFASNKQDLLKYLPNKKPNYKNKEYSPYTSKLSALVKENINNDLYFAEDIINLIQSKPIHEIASHTFSHYYCSEDGQSIEEFKADIEAAIKIAKSKGIKLNSFVFPRNQFNKQYLEVLAELGISSYRGNASLWFDKATTSTTEQDKNYTLRLLRLIDSYINLSGHNSFSLNNSKLEYPHNITSSRFLRPYSNTLKFLDGLRLKRIKNSMTYAAKNNQVYHLWWHPHNFGQNLNENLLFLKHILEHFKYLNKKYDYQSVTMNDCSNEIKSY